MCVQVFRHHPLFLFHFKSMQVSSARHSTAPSPTNSLTRPSPCCATCAARIRPHSRCLTKQTSSSNRAYSNKHVQYCDHSQCVCTLPNRVRRWYHGLLSQSAAVECLQEQAPGSFLCSLKDEQSTLLVSAVMPEGVVQHLELRAQQPKGYKDAAGGVYETVRSTSSAPCRSTRPVRRIQTQIHVHNLRTETLVTLTQLLFRH